MIGFLWWGAVVGQSMNQDSFDYDYVKINTYALGGNVKAALQLLDTPTAKPCTERAVAMKKAYQKRFISSEGLEAYIAERTSPLDELLRIYANYWRTSLLQPTGKFDTLLNTSLATFFAAKFSLSEKMPLDSIKYCLKQFVEGQGYQTTGYSQTGKLLDLLVWKDQYDTTYTFHLKGEKIHAKVVFLESFVTLGWSEFATLGRSTTGGWATRDAIYCVKKSYDLNSEKFLLSFLAHEGKHLSDKRQFPGLSSTDLEYRAKLAELSMAQKTVYELLNTFRTRAIAGSDNAHSIANYYVIRDLSRSLWGKDWEGEEKAWSKEGVKKINSRAFQLLKAHTQALHNKGASTTRSLFD
jgi:hypothetical protein